jgi:hypothetical protein
LRLQVDGLAVDADGVFAQFRRFSVFVGGAGRHEHEVSGALQHVVFGLARGGLRSRALALRAGSSTWSRSPV